MPRPSSPLSAKAFTRCPSFTRPAPRTSPFCKARSPCTMPRRHDTKAAPQTPIKHDRRLRHLKAEHPPRRLNRDGQKQAYHAWRSPNTAPRQGWRTTLDEPPDRTNSFEHHEPNADSGARAPNPTIDRDARVRPDLPLHDVKTTTVRQNDHDRKTEHGPFMTGESVTSLSPRAVTRRQAAGSTQPAAARDKMVGLG